MKRIGSLILAVLLLCCLWLPAVAENDAVITENAMAEDDPFDRSYTRFNDFAGAVTEDEEAQLNAKVRAKIAELRMDLPVCVFYTRQSTTTLSEFAADFYERNKFGCGEEKSGILLVVDTKNTKYDIYYYGEADTLIGDEARQALSDTFKADCRNEDLTYYDAFDRYYDAAFRMVEDARVHPTTEPQTRADGEMPDWYPEGTRTYALDRSERSYAATADFRMPRVTDNADFLTDAQKQACSDALQALCEQYGLDLVIFTDTSIHTPELEQYVDDFYYYNGGGAGGICFYLFDTGSYHYGTLLYGKGSAYEKLDISQRLYDAIREDAPDRAIEQYVELLTFMLGHGRLPMKTSTAVFCFIVGLVVGLIVASIVLGKLKGAMRIKNTVGANPYLVNGSFRLLSKNSHFLYTTVTRTAKPKETTSSSSGGGSSRGGSSYSSGHSAGGSYSSGGRRF